MNILGLISQLIGIKTLRLTYIYNEKLGRGVNCEEEMREKNEMGEEGCLCVVGEKKK